ncbi:hypothetical protein BD410DRAFT_311456 [Rickenella mellea]|uniref:Uncharacterized protein n=1 Tax=Rickenella mellea TaxID=50990 RepID=A0A4Y7Q0U1_9AGAM|nr:hypothetical protein BD410DRAFT_311456 [Rickenella mellea]
MKWKALTSPRAAHSRFVFIRSSLAFVFRNLCAIDALFLISGSSQLDLGSRLSHRRSNESWAKVPNITLYVRTPRLHLYRWSQVTFEHGVSRRTTLRKDLLLVNISYIQYPHQRRKYKMTKTRKLVQINIRAILVESPRGRCGQADTEVAQKVCSFIFIVER